MLSFVLAGDGRVTGVAVGYQGPPNASPPPADCVRAAVTSWEFPRPHAGGRMWFEVAGIAADQAPPAVDRSPGLFRPPREEVRGCVSGSIRVLPGAVTARITAKYFVGADGRASDFVLISKAEDWSAIAFARAVREAVRSCPFIPGVDESGKPVGLWIVQPFFVLR